MQNTQNFSQRYQQSLTNTQAPIFLSQLPKVKMNLKGLSNYAKEKGVAVSELTEEERNQFGVYSQEDPTS